MAHEDDIRHLTQQVHALQNRIVALEQKLGDTINLQSAGGNGITISQRGIEIISATGVSIIAGATLDITAGAAMSVTSGAAMATTVGGACSWNIGGNATTAIGGTSATSVGKQVSLSTMMGVAVTAKSIANVSLGDAMNVSVAKNATIESGTELKLTTGSAAIDTKKDGTIAIKGKDFSINASGKINMKASSDVVIKGSKVLQN